MISGGIECRVFVKCFGNGGEGLAIVTKALECHPKVNVHLRPNGESALQRVARRREALLLEKREAICSVRCRKIRTDLKGAFQPERSRGGITCGQLHRAELVIRIRTIPCKRQG